jgi:secreted trypsin-like serine protease
LYFLAEAGEFPFMALLFKRTIEFVYIYLCGGSLISDKFVITAGHCHRKYPGEEFFVTFGKVSHFKLFNFIQINNF